MIYLSFLSQTYIPKNKLQAAVQEMLRNEDRTAIKAYELKAFKEEIVNSIEALNIWHKRCKPIKATWDNGYGTDKGRDEYLRGVECCQFILYASTPA